GYTALSSRLSAAAGLTPLRPWRDALAVALREAGWETGRIPSTP
ncbi:MAG: NAD(P)-dependent oxidoreductase, partial [Mycobacterium sp.]